MSKQHRDEQLERQIKIGHETRDANIKWILISGVALAALVIGTMFLMKATYGFLFQDEPGADSPRPPLAAARVGPSGPLLQANPYGDLKAFRRNEETILNSYARHYTGDTPLDTVSIPIARAMDLVIERGLLAGEPHPQTQTTTQPAQAPQTQP
jgi:hypothetical protein